MCVKIENALKMVRFCTYNARGLGDFKKRKQLYTLLKYKKVDVVFIQETHARESEMHLWRSQWGGQILFANGSSASKGVVVLVGRDFEASVQHQIIDPCGRYLIVEVIIQDVQIVLCNIYAPNVDSPNFFTEVVKHLETYENSNIIWGGDFNFVIDNEIDRKFSHYNNNRARDMFLQYAEQKELNDVWRIFNPEARQYSCCRPNSDSNEWQKLSRLDMFFVSSGLMNGISNCKMQTGFQSDHSFVLFDLELNPDVRGPGYWKFNSSHLYDKQFLHAASANIQESIETCTLEDDLKWEYVKGRLIEFCKVYGKDKARDKKKQMLEISSRLEYLKVLVEEFPYTENEAIFEYQLLKAERERLIAEKVNGMIVRSREKYFEEGERSSKYFFSLEKHRARKKVMYRIKDENGQVISNQKEILKQQKAFYTKLYKANQNAVFKLVNQTDNKICDFD